MNAAPTSRCPGCFNRVMATICSVCKMETVLDRAPFPRLPLIVPGDTLLHQAQLAAAESGKILQCKGDKAVLHDRLLPGYTDIGHGADINREAS